LDCYCPTVTVHFWTVTVQLLLSIFELLLSDLSLEF